MKPPLNYTFTPKTGKAFTFVASGAAQARRYVEHLGYKIESGKLERK